MSNLFYVAATLLVANGLLHLVKVFLTPGAILPMVVMILFGVAYLVIGYLLFRRNDSALLAGIIVPLIGFLMALASISTSTGILTYIFIVLDVIVIAACAVLFLQSRRVIRRVQ